jgi:hypothetical protein
MSVGAALADNGCNSYDLAMEVHVAKLESDVAHIKDDTAEIKRLLARLAPAVDRIDGFVQPTLPARATKLQLADLRSELKLEIADLKGQIEQRPTHRQIVLDLFALAAFVSAVAAFTARVVH